jgi:hypothetical protein
MQGRQVSQANKKARRIGSLARNAQTNLARNTIVRLLLRKPVRTLQESVGRGRKAQHVSFGDNSAVNARDD